jgi:hypothetical protein
MNLQAAGRTHFCLSFPSFTIPSCRAIATAFICQLPVFLHFLRQIEKENNNENEERKKLSR